jgi:hypothetical protein
MQRIILVNRRREIFQAKRVYWQPRYVLLVANSTYRDLETTFEFSREALQELANALATREQTQQRELALIIDLDNGENEAFSRQRAAEYGADVSLTVELD